MEIQQMKYFLKVAELESISKAADSFNISQPAMSKIIAHMEWELGTQLFDRIKKHLYLNERGKILLNSIKNSMKELNDGINKVKTLAEAPMGKVIIAAFSAQSIIAESLRAYSLQNPNVKFRLCSDLIVKSEMSDLDILFFSDRYLFDNYESLPILSEHSVAIVNKHHRLACRTEIDLIELKNDPFVFYLNLTGDYTYNLCLKAGFTPNAAFEIDSTSIKPELVDSGAAVGIVPEIVIEEHRKAYPNMVFLPLKSPNYMRTIYIGWKRDSYLTEAARSYKDFAVQYYKDYAEKHNLQVV